MEIIPKLKNYEDLNVTTITMVITFTGPIIRESVFYLLPVTKYQEIETKNSQKKKKKKIKIPFLGKGSIISIQYKDKIRGLITNLKKSFKNIVSMYISVKRKNLNVKLSTKSLHICGASRVKDGKEAMEYLFDYIRKIQKCLDLLKNDENNSTFDWIIENTKGEEVLNDEGEKDFLIIKPKEIPSFLNKEIYQVLFWYITDFNFHSHFCKKLQMIKIIDKTNEGELKISNVNEIMVNYNYSLGFQVDRNTLNEIFKERGIVSRYNTSIRPSVTIEIPYHVEETAGINRRRNKVSRHTFMVYRTGSITQTGPNIELMRDIYYLFFKIILENLELIKSKNNKEPIKKNNTRVFVLE
jgi:hypothetical protein